MAIHTARQKITKIQRSRYFWRDPPCCFEALGSCLSSFISCSAWFCMAIAGKPFFHRQEFRSDSGVRNNNFCETKTSSSDLPRPQTIFHYAESCPEWERCAFYQEQDWKQLRSYMLHVGGNYQPRSVRTSFHLHLPSMVVG